LVVPNGDGGLVVESIVVVYTFCLLFFGKQPQRKKRLKTGASAQGKKQKKTLKTLNHRASNLGF
jgi:hypothetical protein